MWQILHASFWKFSKPFNSGISLNRSIIDDVVTAGNTTAYFLAHSVCHYVVLVSDACSLDVDKMSPDTLQMAHVHSSGDVIWWSAMSFRTYCPLDLTHFPYDEHVCTIRLISWTYFESEVSSTFLPTVLAGKVNSTGLWGRRARPPP